MKPRIEDVARAIGVSAKTVSRVLNDEPNVSDAMRARVLEGLQGLDYQPNQSARSLASHRSFLIALLYDNPSPNYVTEVQNGVLEACDAQRYSMLVRPLSFEALDFLKQVESFVLQSRPDGMVLTPPICDYPPLLHLLRKHEMPFACISPKDPDVADGVSIAMDERSAACAMVHHLVTLGHRCIAHISGPSTHGASAWRLAGYRDGLEQAGLNFDPSLVAAGQFSFDSGVAAAHRLFTHKSRPTAIFAGNDDTAAGVLWAAAENGLRVPDDISVCGFDDTPLSRQVWPLLTTVSQPSEEMGRIVTQELLRGIKHKGHKSEKVVMPFALRLRQSTAPPRNSRARRPNHETR
ncbi:MAG TPA: LacI family DNA-binding transcriptional regulator [Rhodanobacteraceae bacterium]